MTIKIYDDLDQGSDEWHAARCGLLTASEMKLFISAKTGKALNNETLRKHLWELAAQRISEYTEPTYIGDAMLRGHEDEILARNLYSETRAPVTEVGFVTNDKWGFTLGCSPDGLVGKDGMIECKSRIQKYQIQTIVEEYRETGKIPDEFAYQVQTGMMVCEKEYNDFVSYSGGLPMVVIRVEPDADKQDQILEVTARHEKAIKQIIEDFHEAIQARDYAPTKRTIEEEMVV